MTSSHQVIDDGNPDSSDDHISDDREVCIGVLVCIHTDKCTNTLLYTLYNICIHRIQHTPSPSSPHHPHPTQVTPPRFELGRDVTKVFDGRLFRGHITGIDSDDDNGELLYTVVYENMDTEDLNPQECEKVTTLSADIKTGRVKEWKVDDE